MDIISENTTTELAYWAAMAFSVLVSGANFTATIWRLGMSDSKHMAIDKEEAKSQLLERERELTEEIARSNEEARESRPAEVEDPIDEVSSSQAKAGSFAVSNVAAETLIQVRAALQRLETGEYGTCVDCGRAIEEARLKAVPWTPYCLEDQEKHDREREEPSAFQASSV